MVNLKALESRLDVALESETKNSLLSWLLKKRVKAYMAFLGESKTVNLETKNTVATVQLSHDFKSESEVEYCDELSQAA